MTIEEQLAEVTKERDQLRTKLVEMQRLIDFLRQGWLKEIEDGMDRAIRQMQRMGL